MLGQDRTGEEGRSLRCCLWHGLTCLLIPSLGEEVGDEIVRDSGVVVC